MTRHKSDLRVQKLKVFFFISEVMLMCLFFIVLNILPLCFA